MAADGSLDHLDSGDGEVTDADSIRIAVCGCPAVHFVLLDDKGHAFAHAEISVEQFLATARSIESQLSGRTSDDPIGICQGTA